MGVFIVKAGGNQAKFWLYPIELALNYGFRAHELNEIGRIVEQHHFDPSRHQIKAIVGPGRRYRKAIKD